MCLYSRNFGLPSGSVSALFPLEQESRREIRRVHLWQYLDVYVVVRVRALFFIESGWTARANKSRGIVRVAVIRARPISSPGRYLGISIGDKLSGEICSRRVHGASKYLTTI